MSPNAKHSREDPHITNPKTQANTTYIFYQPILFIPELLLIGPMSITRGSQKTNPEPRGVGGVSPVRDYVNAVYPEDGVA